MNNLISRIKRTVATAGLVGSLFGPSESYGLNSRHVETQYQTISDEQSDFSIVPFITPLIFLATFTLLGTRAIRSSYKQAIEEELYEEKLKLKYGANRK